MGMETLLREAAGDKFYLHLERARAGCEEPGRGAASRSRGAARIVDSMVNNAKEKFGRVWMWR